MVRRLRIQLNQIQQGGIPILFNKIVLISLIVIAVPLVICVRILRPFILVRFRSLNSPRLGHYAANTELYLCEKDFGLHKGKTIDIFGTLPAICNKFLHEKWKEYIHISPMGRALDIANRSLPLRNIHIIPISSDKDPHGLIKRTEPHIIFNESENNLGESALRGLGIPPNNPFVCFFTRDDTYLSSTYPHWGDWSRHDYRDSEVNDCVQACEYLTNLGYFVIRMGAVVKGFLNTTNPMIIDYANVARSDFLDIYLPSKCSFFFGSCAGLNAIPRLFRKPVGYINFVPLDYEHFFSCSPNSLLIPKKLWLQKDERLMTFREIIETGANEFKTTSDYQKHGIKLIDNSPQEIQDLVIEMHKRTTKGWVFSQTEETLQNQFRSLFVNNNKLSYPISRVESELDPDLKWSMQKTFEDQMLSAELELLYGDSYQYGAIDVRVGATFLQNYHHLLD